MTETGRWQVLGHSGLHRKTKIIFTCINIIPKYFLDKVIHYTFLIFKTSAMTSLTFISVFNVTLIIVNESLLALIPQTFNISECLKYIKNSPNSILFEVGTKL